MSHIIDRLPSGGVRITFEFPPDHFQQHDEDTGETVVIGDDIAKEMAMVMVRDEVRNV